MMATTSQPSAHESAQSHQTLMSVMFGVALGFWVNTLHTHDFKDWSWPLGASICITLAVIICVYWWYIHLCSLFPSRTLVSYLIDFIIVIGLCSLSKSCGDNSMFMWTLAWGFLAFVASLKVWCCLGPLRNHPEPFLVWPPRIAAPVIFLLALYAGTLARQSPPSILVRVLIWGPVAIGIIVTFMVAKCRSRKSASGQQLVRGQTSIP